MNTILESGLNHRYLTGNSRTSCIWYNRGELYLRYDKTNDRIIQLLYDDASEFFGHELRTIIRYDFALKGWQFTSESGLASHNCISDPKIYEVPAGIFNTCLVANFSIRLEIIYVEVLAQEVGCIFSRTGGAIKSTPWQLESAVIDGKVIKPSKN